MNIQVNEKLRDENGWVFVVVIEEGDSKTSHEVEADRVYGETLTGKPFDAAQGKELVRRSFEFLLAREPKESILRKFNLRDIEHYFPEYKKHIITSL